MKLWGSQLTLLFTDNITDSHESWLSFPSPPRPAPPTLTTHTPELPLPTQQAPPRVWAPTAAPWKCLAGSAADLRPSWTLSKLLPSARFPHLPGKLSPTLSCSIASGAVHAGPVRHPAGTPRECQGFSRQGLDTTVSHLCSEENHKVLQESSPGLIGTSEGRWAGDRASAKAQAHPPTLPSGMFHNEMGNVTIAECGLGCSHL